MPSPLIYSQADGALRVVAVHLPLERADLVDERRGVDLQLRRQRAVELRDAALERVAAYLDQWGSNLKRT